MRAQLSPQFYFALCISEPIFTTGCSQINDCRNHEKQNFGSGMMRQLMSLQCRPFWYGGQRHFRPVNCNFCHKMGTWEKTNLLFQNDTIGTNDENSILIQNGEKVETINLENIYLRPYRHLMPNKMLANQEWYMINKPYY